MRLHSVRGHSLYVAPIRIGLGLLWLLAARLVGVSQASVLLAFAGGIFMIVFVAFNDPRRVFVRGREPEPVPVEATYAHPLAQALAATLPSTVGVGVIAVAALAFEPAITAICGGISAGLGVAGALAAARADPELWFDRKAHRIYRR